MNTFGPPKHIGGGIVNAYCPVCDARSSFEPVHSAGGEATFTTQRTKLQDFKQTGHYTSFTYKLLTCNGCSLAAFAEFRKYGSNPSTFNDFYPRIKQVIPLPKDTPADISSEFRSAENCANIDEFRPAAAMLRSTIEKVLSEHGYNDWLLSKNLERLKKDRLITAPLARKNEQIVKALGDEVLHKKWRDITPEEYLVAQEYTVKLIDAFYGDIEEVAIEMKRIEKEREEKRKEKEELEGQAALDDLGDAYRKGEI